VKQKGFCVLAFTKNAKYNWHWQPNSPKRPTRHTFDEGPRQARLEIKASADHIIVYHRQESEFKTTKIGTAPK
jgi:hypothetical protein